MTTLHTKETDALANFESIVNELCNKNIDKPEMFPSFNSIKNRECYLDDLIEVSNLTEEILKKVRKRIEQVNTQQKEEIDKFDEQIKKLKQHNLEIAVKLTDISDSLEKVHNSKQSILESTPPKKTQDETIALEIPAAPKPKHGSKPQVAEKQREFGDILHLLDDSFSRENIPFSRENIPFTLEEKIQPRENSHVSRESTAIALKNSAKSEVFSTDMKMHKFPKAAEFDSDWSLVAPRKHKKRNAGPYAQTHDTEAMNLPIYKPVVVSGEYAIKAVICSDWPEITEMLEGCMYYVATADHFAIKLCGVMLHGNIGEIYTNERNPIKIKECKFGADCNKDNCEYYHDPLFSDGKKDIRNYIAGSFLYSPLTGLKPKSIGSRKIGSRSTIESDINRLDEYDIKLHRDQVMHDLLCCLLIPL